MSVRRRLEELRDQAVRKIVTALVMYEGGLRVKPATIERIREIVADLILATRNVLELYAGKPDLDQPTEDELADTRPMRTRPPPPPKPKA